MNVHLAPSADLEGAAVVATLVVAAAGLVLLGVELWRAGRPRGTSLGVAGSGLVAAALLVTAVLRPVRVESDDVSVGPRVLVLLDASRSVDLPGDGAPTRRATLRDAARALIASAEGARIAVATFGVGGATALPDAALADGVDVPAAPHSDLTAALESVARDGEEPPAAVVVVSDGRLDRPTPEGATDRALLGTGPLEIPVHTVHLGTAAPQDAAVRAVRAAGAAVAHQPLSLRVEVACTGGLACGEIPVVARELEDRGAPEELARGKAAVGEGGVGTVELTLTLHRAGPRVVEVAIDAPSGDAVPDNDRRYVVLDVSRDRVRVLHIAGRPTYDVRAMRTWLKGDGSVDVVAFFILRTLSDNVGAMPSELALIPFPVDELFTVHLPSFDAVVLQDFDAEAYALTPHLGSLARYVDAGGGLIMVGGPTSFGPGKYAGSPLADVLPVALEREHERDGSDGAWFTPSFTAAGRVAPVLGPLRDVVGDALPEMPGTNRVGVARPGATVLLSHPTLLVEGAPMPVLALGEHGTGRTIALTVDGTHRLAFSTFAAEQAGRGYGALWDGLLGWLMRDPKYESTTVDLAAGCIAGQPSELLLRPLPGARGEAAVSVVRLGRGAVAHEARVPLAEDGQPTRIPLPPLDAGGYAASVRLVQGEAVGPATRRDFACERGGDEWADVRPDPERLAAIAKATGGVAVGPDDTGLIPWPAAVVVASERRTRPVAPPWAWTTAAAAMVGAHWIARRRAGLS